MGKNLYEIACLLGCFCLTGCGNENTSSNESLNDSSVDSQQTIDSAHIIFFDGVYVKGSSNSWPIAFSSYLIEENNLFIYGNFEVPSNYANKGLTSITDSLTASCNAGVFPYKDGTSSSVIGTSRGDASWDLTGIDEDNIVSFVLTIDVSAIFDEGNELGELYLNNYFDVFHYFKGEYDGVFYDYTQGLNQ